jgi:hypothetical protein
LFISKSAVSFEKWGRIPLSQYLMISIQVIIKTIFEMNEEDRPNQEDMED